LFTPERTKRSLDAMLADMRVLLALVPPLPPPTRRERLGYRLFDAREALARKVAPWLS
jgi:hypothetical protein